MNTEYEKEMNDEISGNNETVIDIGPILRHLSQSKGKLEIAFQKNENPSYESLCLVFLKIPVYGPIVNILRDMIEVEGSNELPLSKGKLSIDSKDETLHAFVGAVRIKSLNKSSDIIGYLLERMKRMLKLAITMSKRDDIGNISVNGNVNPRNLNSLGLKKPTGKPYTFSRDND